MPVKSKLSLMILCNSEKMFTVKFVKWLNDDFDEIRKLPNTVYLVNLQLKIETACFLIFLVDFSRFWLQNLMIMFMAFEIYLHCTVWCNRTGRSLCLLSPILCCTCSKVDPWTCLKESPGITVAIVDVVNIHCMKFQ